MARHPATPPRILQHLVLDKRRLWSSTKARPVVQHAIASNPHTPLATIYQLVSAAKTCLRSRAATHPALEDLDHEIIALDAETSVRASLATLPRLAPHLFAQLATDPAPTVRASLARNLRVPLDILHELSRDAEPMVRAAAAGNPRLPVEIQATLLNDHAGSVRASLSGNARVHTDHALVLAQDPSPRVRAYLAANPRTPVALLSILLEAQEPEIWRGLARHPKTPPDMLTQLAQRDDQRTRIAVAAHTRTPVEILAELAQKNTHAIWCALASNPQTPLHVLEPALRTYSLDLLHRLINHPAMRREKHRPLLKLLATQIQSLIATNRLPDWLRRVFLQYTAALPVEITTLFATSPYWQERYLLACRPHLPTTVLQTLAQDGIYYVQAAARKALEQRQNPEQARRPHRKLDKRICSDYSCRVDANRSLQAW